MKKTALEKLKAAKIVTEMRKTAPADRYAQGSNAVPNRREQRRLDRERGLVPFAVKIDSELVAQLRKAATERGVDMNDLIDEMLRKALDVGR
jgi:hypothetical protein